MLPCIDLSLPDIRSGLGYTCNLPYLPQPWELLSLPHCKRPPGDQRMWWWWWWRRWVVEYVPQSHKYTFSQKKQTRHPEDFYSLSVASASIPDVSQWRKSDKCALKDIVGFALVIKLIIHASHCCYSAVCWANKCQIWFVCLRARKCRGRSLQHEPIHSSQLCMTFRPITIIAFSGV